MDESLFIPAKKKKKERGKKMDKTGSKRMEAYGFTTQKGGQYMNFKKIFTILTLCLVIGFLGCSKDQKVESPKLEQVTTNLVPSKAEVKGPAFLLELSDLKVVTLTNPATKEMVETPVLKGSIKITNKSKDILDIQAITLEYLDEAGKPIPYKPEEKIVKVYSFWKALQPEATTEGSLDVTVPTIAIKEKSLKKIEFNLVYVPSPLKRETLTLSGKIE
jgi:hypothetical protein